jgi:lipopolysaccharide transport system permease protein
MAMIGYFQKLLEGRELLYFLTLREIKAKYKQTVLGVSWAFLQPLLLMLTFTVVFSLLTEVPTDGLPYAIFSYCAILPWSFFSGILSRGTGSLVSNQVLINKIYFPRDIIPLAVIGAAIVDFVIGAMLFVVLLWFYHIPLTAYGLLFFPIFLIQLLLTTGLILILSPLNVFYRDIGHVLPLLTQIWMFATPVIYPLSVVPESFRAIYSLNPMAGIIDGYRAVLLHGTLPDMQSLTMSLLVALAALGGGLVYFKRVEFELADVI